MLGFYLPFVAKAGAGREYSLGGGLLVPGRKVALCLAAGLAMAAIGSLLWRGVPGVDLDERMLRPRNSQAMAAFGRVQEMFPRWGSDALRVVVEAPDAETMRARLAEAQARLGQNSRLGKAELPTLWWPDEARQQANRASLREMAENSEMFFTSADATGLFGTRPGARPRRADGNEAHDAE